MKCCQSHLKTCFRKRLTVTVIIQDMQPNKTILYKFQQNLVKKTISHRGYTLWANVEQHFKDNPTMSLISNTDQFCCCSMNE